MTGLAFKDGSTIDCDMVVVAAGVRPNSEIGLRAGLTVERAIVVNDHMQSIDDRSVYAVGECAQHRGKVYGLVAPLWDQASVFADHVTGRDSEAAYHGSKLATKLKVMGVELASMGITEPKDEHDEVIQFAEPKRGTYKKLIVRDGRLVGGILMGEVSKAPYLMQAFDRDSPLPEERLALLFDLGSEPQVLSVEEMPADAKVCNCNGVTKGTIGASVAAGCRDAKAVMTADPGRDGLWLLQGAGRGADGAFRRSSAGRRHARRGAGRERAARRPGPGPHPRRRHLRAASRHGGWPLHAGAADAHRRSGDEIQRAGDPLRRTGRDRPRRPAQGRSRQDLERTLPRARRIGPRGRRCAARRSRT